MHGLRKGQQREVPGGQARAVLWSVSAVCGEGGDEKV
jgi:hypothetical protein